MSRKPARAVTPQSARPARSTARPRDPANAGPPVPPAPPLARDPWAWASLLAILPLLARCIGAPLGEPVAEDFDFLRRALFHGPGSLFDGGGSTAFWRPVAHQVYYATLGPLILDHPRAIASLHALLLAAGALLVYRALRPSLGGMAACVAASFPCFAESTRTLVGWPSQFVDVGLYFFTALALHETSRRRLPSALAAALLALLCKEVAVVGAVLLPWFPDARSARERVRWAAAFAALLLAWGGAYLAVRHAAHLALPHHLEQDPLLLGTPIPARIAWALGGSLRAVASLMLVPGPNDALAGALGIGLLATVGLAIALRPGVRARLAARRAWPAWGLAWFLAATAALTPIFPLWQPNRSHFGSAGLGIAAAVTCEAVHPALVGGLVLGRMVLLAIAPAPAGHIASEPARTGAFMDFEQLTRLQRFMSETRQALRVGYPTAAPHATLIEMNLPRGLIYALGGDRAVQAWYRDSTLKMANFSALADDSALVTVAGVQYQPTGTPQVVLLSPDAMRAQDQAYRALRFHRWLESVTAVDRADSLTPDPRYVIFHGNNAGYRAFAWLQMGRAQEAEAESRRALSLDPLDRNGLLTLASALAGRGRLDEALVQVEHLLRIDPGQKSASDLRARIVAAQPAVRAR
jgi:tetratricopeptide (TPR) repeat protein